MFGYVRINKMDLTFREYEHYKSYYCGLCKYLKENHGGISRLGLNYDITFLIVILSAIYKPKTNIFEEKCIVSPFKNKKKIINEITEYAASMNILLTYYKLQDNLLDDKGIKDIFAYNLYKNKLSLAHKKYPHKSNIIREQMNLLNQLEKDKECSIDKISNSFGEIMGEIFSYKDDEYEDDLRKIGFNIGKYIYILDAYEDLEEDYKKGRYNPFIEYINNKNELKLKVDRLISISLGLLSSSIDNLKLQLNRGIIENIVYSGVYLRYKNILEKGCENNVQ